MLNGKGEEDRCYRRDVRDKITFNPINIRNMKLAMAYHKKGKSREGNSREREITKVFLNVDFNININIDVQ